MDQKLTQVLNLFAQPAFWTKDGVVQWFNSAAAPYVYEGMNVIPLIEGQPFAQWNRKDILQVSVVLGDCAYDATVQPTEDGELFVASRPTSEVRAAAAAAVSSAASLTAPLHNMLNAAERLFSQLEGQPSVRESASVLNQSIYRMMRLCGQLSDGGNLLLRMQSAYKTTLDVKAFFDELVCQALPLVERMDRKLVYEPLPASLRADVDKMLLERAIYNLLSNSLQHTPKGGTVTLSLQRQGSCLLIQVKDDGEGISTAARASLFSRFSEMAVGGHRHGIGMGLSIVREVARLHNGTMTVASDPEKGGTTVTFSISLERATITLRSPVFRMERWDNRHHGLVELSDVLDASVFDPEEVL